MHRAWPWPDTKSKTGYRLENLRIALALLDELIRSVNVQELLRLPLELERKGWEIESAARRATWMERNLRAEIDCTELERIAAVRRDLLSRASALLDELGVQGAQLVVAEGAC